MEDDYRNVHVHCLLTKAEAEALALVAGRSRGRWIGRAALAAADKVRRAQAKNAAAAHRITAGLDALHDIAHDEDVRE